MKVDFSKYLEYREEEPSPPPEPEPIPKADMSIWHKKHDNYTGIKFDIETNPYSEVIVTDVWYRKQIPIIITERDINRWALGGGPMY